MPTSAKFAMPDPTTDLKVKITSPEKTIWEGKANSISSINSAGPFDILPFHANFVTIIENKPIKVKSGTEMKEYTFSRAVLYARNNEVSIYVNI